MSALLVASTLFTATAAPMPKVVEAELEPSALAVPLLVPFELSVNVLALTVTPIASEVSALVLAVLTATPFGRCGSICCAALGVGLVADIAAPATRWRAAGACRRVRLGR